MYSWLYRGSPLVVYPLVALVLFLAVFIVVVLRTYWRGNRASLESAAQLPLFDGERHFDLANAGDPHARGVSHV